MKKTHTLPFVRFILGMALLMCACGGSAVPSTITATPSPTSTATPEPTATALPPTATPGPVGACKLPPFAFTNVGLGLPNPTYKMPSTGHVKAIVLFADFNDVPAVMTPQEIFSLISPGAENFYSTVSYGRMSLTLEPHFVWLRLSQPSAHYGEGIHSYEGDLEFIQEAVNLADAEVDFSTADSVVVMVPPEASAITYGPAFGADEGLGYTADGKVFENGVTSGADLYVWGYLWLNHESGHTMGLADLYAYQYDLSNYDDLYRFAGGFSVMSSIIGNAPEYFAFERWQLGWLDDAQIICQTVDDQITNISPIETAGGVKAVIVPISSSKAVIVESRRQIGFDQTLPKAGALVYTVDTSIASGMGPLIVYPILENDPYRYQSPLANGESVTVENVTITVIESTAEGDTVRITVKH